MSTNLNWLIALSCIAVGYFSALRSAKRDQANLSLNRIDNLRILANFEKKELALKLFDKSYRSLERMAEQKILWRESEFSSALFAFYILSFGYLLFHASTNFVLVLIIAVWLVSAYGMKSGRDEWNATVPDLIADSFNERSIRSLSETDHPDIQIDEVAKRLRFFEHIILARNGPPPGIKHPEQWSGDYSEAAWAKREMLF